MLNKLVITFMTAGLVAAFAANGSYKVDILQDSNVNGHQVKAGTYKIEVENNTAVLKHGKESIEVHAHAESVQAKYSNTQMRYVDNNNLQEIHVGGTNTKIVFDNASNAAPGSF